MGLRFLAPAVPNTLRLGGYWLTPIRRLLRLLAYANTAQFLCGMPDSPKSARVCSQVAKGNENIARPGEPY